MAKLDAQSVQIRHLLDRNCVKTRNAPRRSPWPQWLNRWFGTAAPPAPTPAPDTQAEADNPKQQRLRRTARREHLYGVVRENMIRAGVLSSSYKFKVLTLDHDGLSHLVLIDIEPGAYDLLAGGPQAIEAELQALALERLGVEVKAVYWRQHGPAKAAARSSSVPAESVTQDEIQALHAALNGRKASTSPRPDFEPTQPMARPRKRGHGPLSDTQLGELE